MPTSYAACSASGTCCSIRWTARCRPSTRPGPRARRRCGWSARWIRSRGLCMSSAKPDVSIVICTRNRAPQLRGMLDSLMAMRTERPWEAILVDNGSTDGTAEVIRHAAAKEPRIRYVREQRIGLGAARDRGWREAQSDLLSFTDDDCYVAEDYVDAVVAAFHGRPDVGVVGGRILLFDTRD